MERNIVLNVTKWGKINGLITILIFLTMFIEKYPWMPLLIFPIYFYVILFDNPVIILSENFISYKTGKLGKVKIIQYESIKNVEMDMEHYWRPGAKYLYVEYFDSNRRVKIINIQMKDTEQARDIYKLLTEKNIPIDFKSYFLKKNIFEFIREENDTK